MISNISIKNFKSLREIESLKIKPITILCGANSCGKSSVLKSMLLVKQTLDHANLSKDVIFNTNYAKLGDYRNVVYKNDVSKDIEIEYSFVCSDRNKDSFKKFLRTIVKEYGNINGNTYNLKMKFGLTNNEEGKIHNSPVVKSYEIEVLEPNSIDRTFLLIELFDVKNARSGYNLTFGNVPNLFYAKSTKDTKISTEDLANIKAESRFSGTLKKVGLEFHGIYPMNIRRNANDDFESYATSISVDEFLRSHAMLFRGLLTGIKYIGPLREEPSRRYIFDNVVADIGVKGENAPYILLQESEKLIKNHYFFDYTKRYLSKIEQITLKDAVSNWLDYMNIENFKISNEKEIIRITLNDMNHTNTEVNIADVGFGVSQIFPIILEGLRMTNNNILLLEQPEIHLHPSLQMKLADYFIAMAKSGKSLVIETHSDHIINRLVRRIVESEGSLLQQLIQIYFVSPSENGAIFNEIEIDNSRGIINWPEGFFDQNASEQEITIKAGLEKRKKERESIKKRNEI